MRFKITRTSFWDDETPPCDGAIRGTCARWDQRTFKSPAEYDRKLGHRGTWLDKGTEHGYWKDGERAEESGIQRRLEDGDCWYIVINSLDELVAFNQKYGDLVLSAPRQEGTLPALEIYDDYRE